MCHFKLFGIKRLLINISSNNVLYSIPKLIYTTRFVFMSVTFYDFKQNRDILFQSQEIKNIWLIRIFHNLNIINGNLSYSKSILYYSIPEYIHVRCTAIAIYQILCVCYTLTTNIFMEILTNSFQRDISVHNFPKIN